MRVSKTLQRGCIYKMDSDEETGLPVLDFADYNVTVDKQNVTNNVIASLASNAINKFEKVGFCYVTNHGIDDEHIRRYLATCELFFKLPTAVKAFYGRAYKGRYHGWVRMEEESLDTDRPGDLKETFDFHPGQVLDVWPESIPEFQKINKGIFDSCHELGYRLLEVIALGLGFDRHFFTGCHKSIGLDNNGTALRSLYYPPLAGHPSFKPGQARLGEHSDYGTITILFQDDTGGLEVEIPGEGFVPATPLPGAALVNIGSMLQRWTSDRLLATVHRVRIPTSDAKKKTARQSVAFFINPDDDVVIHCLDGSKKYEPIRAVDYLNYRILRTVYP